MKSKNPISEKIKELDIKSKQKIKIEDLFELLFKISDPYMDYYESDLGSYLSNKFVGKFPIYTFIRVSILLGIICPIFLNTFIRDIVLRTVFVFISNILLALYYFLDKKISKKENLTIYFLRGRRKRLIIIKNQLELFLSNTYLSESYNTETFNFKKIRIKISNLKNRIKKDIEIIQPVSFYFLNIGLPILLTLLFAPIINTFFNTIPEVSTTPNQINLNAVIYIIINTMLSLGLIIFILTRIRNMIEERKIRENHFYYFSEIFIFAINVLIRDKLKTLEFPNEEEITSDLLQSVKEVFQ